MLLETVNDVGRIGCKGWMIDVPGLFNTWFTRCVDVASSVGASPNSESLMD